MPDSPETNYLSSCLETGQFDPAKDGLGDRHFIVHAPVYHFINSYQEQAGTTPPVAVVIKKFPEFDFEPDVHLGWAADEVRHSHDTRKLTVLLHEMAKQIKAGNLDEVRGLMRDALSEHSPIRAGDRFGDAELFEESTREQIPLPGSAFTELTGGIEEGMLVTVAARTGIGKSWLLSRAAIEAMKAGWNVVYFSLEMDSRMCAARFARMILGPQMDEMTTAETHYRVNEWLDEHSASMTLRTAKYGRVTPEVVASYADTKTMLIVDHVGLMYDDTLTPAISDHRVAAAISHRLHEIAGAHEVPVMIAAQQNRMAEHVTKPGIDAIGGTDAIGQDSDIVLFLSRPAETVTSCHLIKNRNGKSGRWYSSFDPDNNDFEDLPMMAAVTRIQSQQVDESAMRV